MPPPRKGRRDTSATSRSLRDGRVQMLIYLPPATVKSIKQAALDDDTSASAIVETAVEAWLARRRRPRAP